MKRGDLIRLTGTSKIGIVLDVLEARGGRKTCGVWWVHLQRKVRAWMHALEPFTPQGDCEKKIS
jgi:hypothetical protein